MKKSRWLSQEEALSLILRPKPNEKGRNLARYKLTEEEWQGILRGRNSGIIEAHEEHGIDPTLSKFLWLKNKNSSIPVQNPLYIPQAQANQQEFFDKVIDDLQKYAPKFPKIKRKKCKDGHLLVVDIADLHINKYAECHLTGADYNSKIAVERAIEGTKGLIQKASGFNIDKILFVIGNDVLNTDNLTKSTTRNTPQDTDINWFTAFNIAKDCYVKCLELCMAVADVDVIHCPSNHDQMSGCFLASTVHAWFRNCKGMTFNTSPKYRKYYQYYNNMIELEHGDKGKMLNLPLQMANEEPKMWAETKFRYGYLHHVHHQDKTQFKSGKDFTGVNVTYLRSPSSADLWHAESGYNNMVAVEGFIHSKEMGRVSHITHYF